MDVADLLKSGFQSLYKAKSSFAITLNADREAQQNRRRVTRNAIISSKRHIDKNMSPYVTPGPKTATLKTEQLFGQSKLEIGKAKRYQQYLLWKQEKEKKKKEDKQKAKPLFKVTHVSAPVGLPNLENVNKQIKGILITSNKTIKKNNTFKFAPANHKFKAPSNIKSVDFKHVTKDEHVTLSIVKSVKLDFSNSKRVTRSQNAILPVLELPTRRRKLNLEFVNKNNDPSQQHLNKNVKLLNNSKHTSVMKVSTNIKCAAMSSKHLGTSSKQTSGIVQETKQKTENRRIPLAVEMRKPVLEMKDESNNSTNKLLPKTKRKLQVQQNMHNKNSLKNKNTSETPVKINNDLVINETLAEASLEFTKSNNVCHSSAKLRKSKRLSKNKDLKDVRINNSTKNRICDDASTNVEIKIKENQQDDKNSVAESSLSSEYPVCTVTNSGASDTAKCTTPDKIKTPPLVYVSPFVTVSRGKSKARKEYWVRRSTGGSYGSSPDLQASTGKKAGAAYFYRVLDEEVSRIQGLCDGWMLYRDEQNPPEEAVDMINVAIGHSQLLLSKKFRQFRSLIHTCEDQNSGETVTCEDLHGYWDTAYLQVENLNKRFANLDDLKNRNWEEILPAITKIPPKKKVGPKKAKGKVTTSLKHVIKAARMKAKSNKVPDITVKEQSTSMGTFDGKFFTIISPHKSPATRTPHFERKSLLASVLSSQAKRRTNSPGLNIIRASHIAQAIAANEGFKITPTRSILKSGGCRSSRSKSKSVLFKGDNVTESINKHVVTLNETYPPTIIAKNLKSPVDSQILTNITNSAKLTDTRRSSRAKLTRHKLF